jgi:gamma-glutamyl hercynylcysteine S-oxide synthase
MVALETDSLERAREQTLSLVSAVGDGDLEKVHSPLMSPLVWDLGHIAAFEDLWLAHRLGSLPLLQPDLMDVYDAFETPRQGRGDLPFLRRADAERYMSAVRERVRDLGLGAGEPLVELVFRHERQHAETMLQTLALAGLDGWSPQAHGPRVAFDGPPQSGLDMVEVGAAIVPVGAGPEGFSYDNEKPQYEVKVETFRIGRVAVTNGDWLAFVADGGYARAQWWSEEGWAWRTQEQIELPLRWLDTTSERRLDGVHPIDPAAVLVHVSCHEAEAFARAHGLRLPTELEWEVAATWDPALSIKRSWPWGAEAPQPHHANLIESGVFAPLAAGALPAGASPCGALGMIGDVWEWTASEFRGYPGFTPYPYREYSEVFFGSEYRVLRGGAFAASADVVTPTFRNWDYPHRRQIFAGVRIAADSQ